MRYLSLSRRSDNIDVADSSLKCNRRRHGSAFDSRFNANRWRVEFTGSEACKSIRQTTRAAGKSPQETTIADFTGRPILTLFDFNSMPVSGKR